MPMTPKELTERMDLDAARDAHAALGAEIETTYYSPPEIISMRLQALSAHMSNLATALCLIHPNEEEIRDAVPDAVPAPIDDLAVAPTRLDIPATGIYVRARLGETWGSHDIAHLDRESLTRWLHSRDESLAERTLMLLLGHHDDA